MSGTDKIKRLNRVAGQVRGVAQMIEDDRYCMDILHQIAAIKSALAKVESQVLKDHAACCVAEAIASGDETEQRQKFNELVDLFEKRR
jgi:DNA-binding FrmR family transcriptional regulator